MYQLAADFDGTTLQAQLADEGRLQIAPFLADSSALALYRWLSEDAAWRLTANRGEQIVDFDLDQVRRWTPEQHRLLDTAVSAGGRFGFQFRYEVVRIKEGEGGPLAEFAEFMSSPAVIGLMRQVIGANDITFADAHASRYQPGHFLTAHDDRQDTMGRRAAYVLNLTPNWRPDWGGMLQFLDESGNISGGFLPRFNTLNLFTVPQHHNVSWVTPLAAAPRYAITGWLRAAS
jgi:hypothetical protein